MQRKIPLNVMILSQDRTVIGTLQQALCMMPIKATKCEDSQLAQTILKKERFDCVIIDWDSFGEPHKIMATLRSSKKNTKSTVLACIELSQSFAKANKASVDLVVYKPREHENAIQCIKPLVSLLLRKQRATERLPVEWEAMVTHMQGLREQIMITDLSHGGVGIEMLRPTGAKEQIEIKFHVPGTWQKMTLKTCVMWHTRTGAVGAKFVGISDKQQATLDRWLEKEAGKKSRPLNKLPLPIEKDQETEIVIKGMERNLVGW